MLPPTITGKKKNKQPLSENHTNVILVCEVRLREGKRDSDTDREREREREREYINPAAETVLITLYRRMQS